MLQLISDHDTLFMSDLWAAVYKLTGVKLKILTAYCPETDGASEQTNKTVTQAIQSHVGMSQKGWLKQLPWICFALTSTVNSSTGFSGFQLKTGHSPHVIPPIASLANNTTPDDITACAIIDKLNIDVYCLQYCIPSA
jgi:hypothetical protein